MKTKISLFVLAITLAFVACKKDKALPDPVAAFSYSVSGNYVPVTVTFTSTSQNATSLLWNFGDGVTVTTQSPQHTYASAGQYTITLVATNGDGKTNTVTQYLTVTKQVLPMPIVGFSFTGDVTFAPCFATFSNTTTNAVSYNWDFGDGATSTEKTPKHLYSTGGTYNVVLTAMNGDGATTNLIKPVIVGNAPTKVNIKQVTLTGFPATMTDGSGWDITSAPDPYFVISDYPKTVTYYTSLSFSDLILSSLPKTYAANNTLINSVDLNYQIALYDEDVATSEFMGGYYFKFRSFMPTDGTTYPTEIEISNASKPPAFKLTIEWKP